jgi:diacylglycerol kinase family enzyme
MTTPIDPAAKHRAAARLARRRRRRVKPEAEVVLLCNPRAGGRWRELARILDSEEAQFARRIVTDSVEDVASALADLGKDTRLLCVYGGDGTIQRVLDRLTADELEHVSLALLGGGTMNVTSRWLGFSRKPAQNFRHVVRNYRSAQLLLREVPLLEVVTGEEVYRCFTFGMGPVVRLLDAYESGRKGKVAALGMAAKAAAAAWFKRPSSMNQLIAPMQARVTLDGEAVPYDSFSAVFANVTGQINPGVEPFAVERTRDSFHCAAYAVSAREMAAALPMLIRGWLPVDLGELLSPASERAGGLPTDPRYVNRTASTLTVESEETIYTVDGEVLETQGPVSVGLGPTIKLAAGPNLGERMRLAAEHAVKR